MKLNSRISALLLVSSALVVVGVAVNQALAISNQSFSDQQGSGVECDLRRPTQTQNNLITSQMCNGRGLTLWAGQTVPVHLPASGDPDFSESSVRLKAYFRNIPSQPGNSEVVDLSGVSPGSAVVRILGPDLCLSADENNTNNANDGTGRGYFGGDYISQDNETLATINNRLQNLAGENVTRFRVGADKDWSGGVVKRGQIRTNMNNCTGYEEVDLLSINPSHIFPVPGVYQTWYVAIAVEHIDQVGMNRRYGISQPRMDGLVNSFYIRTSGSKSSVTNPSGTNGSEKAAFDPAEGYVVTTKRAGSSKVGTVFSHPDGSYTARVRFGSGCDAGATTGKNPAEETANEANNLGVRFRVTFYDVDGSDRFTDLDGEFAYAHVTIHDETNDTWLLGNTGTGNVGPATTKDGRWVNYSPNFDQTIRIPPSNLSYYVVTFPALNNHKYSMYLLNSKGGLVNQFGVPFEGIYYQQDCNLKVREYARFQNPLPTRSVGESDTAIAGIENIGATLAKVKVEWRRVWFEKDPGGNSYQPGNDVIIGEWLDTGNIISVNTGQTVTLPDFPFIVDPPEGMKRICTDMSVVSAGTPTVTVVNSPPVCVDIVAQYSFRVNNADIRAGGVFDVAGTGVCSITTNVGFAKSNVYEDAKYYIRGHDFGAISKGSLSQYGVIPVGWTSFVGTADSQVPDMKYRLQFGSQPEYGDDQAGFYFGTGSTANTWCLPKLSKYKEGLPAPPTYVGNGSTVSVAGLPERSSYKFNNNGNNHDLRITGGNLPAGSTKIIHVSRVPNGPYPAHNKVIIDGNIWPSGVFNDPSQVPLLMLFLDEGIDIEFTEATEKFFGIIVSGSNGSDTSGRIATCKGKYQKDKATDAECTKQLTIRGGIITSGKVIPFRNFGNSKTTFAETFELSPELLAREFVRARSEPTVTTLNQQELPPRY